MPSFLNESGQDLSVTLIVAFQRGLKLGNAAVNSNTSSVINSRFERVRENCEDANGEPKDDAMDD